MNIKWVISSKHTGTWSCFEETTEKSKAKKVIHYYAHLHVDQKIATL